MMSLRHNIPGNWYTLDEAARIQRALSRHVDAPRCPRCREQLALIRPPGDEEVQMVACETCGASLVVRRSPAVRSLTSTGRR